MTHLHVKVTEKTAYYTGPMPVCGNSDYMVEWELDQEWDDRQSKTMRVVFPDGRYQDTLFSSTACDPESRVDICGPVCRGTSDTARRDPRAGICCKQQRHTSFPGSGCVWAAGGAAGQENFRA